MGGLFFLLLYFVCLLIFQVIAVTDSNDIVVLHDLYLSLDGFQWTWTEAKLMNAQIWNFTTNVSNIDPCGDAWYGITCYRNQSSDVSTVSAIELGSMKLQGTIPLSISQLKQISILNFTNNEITGTIPDMKSSTLAILALSKNNLSGSIPDFTKHPRLSSLDLDTNQLSGWIPDFTNLPQLSYLDLGYNQLSGSIPDFTNLPQLSYLDLDTNQLSGWIPDFTNLPQLSYLDLGYNQLSGSIPDFTNLPQLSYLDLDTNHLSGSILDFRNIPRLIYLDLDTNQLSGSTPDFTNLPQLSYLGLGYNQLSGSIPDFTNLPELSYLDLDTNQLSGWIPDFTNLPQLSYLDLDTNHLSGSIPDFRIIPQLVSLDLDTNQLSGRIPDFINLSYLSALFVYGNHLSGSIPDFINLPELNYLHLGYNRVSGSIPDFTNLSQLSYLDLDTNQLTGSIPDFINLSQLIYLDLDTNQLTGSIPDFADLPELSYLFLYINHLSGSIPDFTNLPELSFLNLGYNHLSGSIPDFTNLPQLSYLDLDNNQLSGSIPDFANLLQLSSLYLGYNHLSGSIPNFTNLPQLSYFNLSTNQLSGFFYELSPTSELLVFDVSENYLIGSLPSFDLSPLLAVLFVRSNYISGTFSFRDLKFLNTLSLSRNLFSGTMDQIFNDIHQNNFTIIDISDNLFVGTIPKEIIEKPSLLIFSAGSNCMEGSIPSEFCSASNLVALSLDGLGTADSCQDQLFPGLSIHTYRLKQAIQGSIPPCLFELPALQVLHLSGNGLTGTLPENIQLGSNLTDLSLSYNRLEGPNNIQGHSWVALDISVNKINGVVAQNLQFLANESRYSFFVNRLSGPLPDSAFNRSVNLNILNGNIFDCAIMNGQNVLPESDPNHESYSCGSQSSNDSLIVWVGISGWFFFLFIGYVLRSIPSPRDPSIVSIKQSILNFEKKIHVWWNITSSETGTRLFQEIAVDHVFRLLRRVCFFLFSLIVFVFLPVYGSLWKFRTHTYSYVWIVSLAYLSGQLPAILLFFIILVAVAACYVFLLSVHLLTIEPNVVIRNLLHLNLQRSSWNLIIVKLFIVLLNTVVVLAINIGYVYLLSLSLNKTQRTSLQVSVAVIKLLWSVTFIKRIFLSVMKRFNTIQEKSSVFGMVQFLSLLNIFNFIVAPMIAAAFFDSNCFKNALFLPSKVQASFSANYFDGDIGYVTYEESLSYSPPFIYNYQCTSSLLAEFVTVFVYKYALSNFLMIVGSLSLIFILKYRFSSDLGNALFIPKQIYFTMMKLKKENLLWNPFAQVEGKILHYFSFILQEDKNDNKCFDGDLIIIGIVGDFAVLLTFGIAFSPLGVIVCFSICLQTIFHQLLLGRLMQELEESLQEDNFVREAIESGKSEENVVRERADSPERYLSLLKKEIAPLWNYFQPSIKYLAIFSAIFLSFFLFDILGDKVGIAGAIWIIPVTSCFPLLIVIIHQLGIKLHKEYRQRRKKANYIIPLSEHDEVVDEARINNFPSSFELRAEDDH